MYPQPGEGGTYGTTDKEIKSAAPQEKAYKLSDAGGLYLDVRPNGPKYWRLKYRFAGKEKLLALGVYPSVTPKEAREQAQEAKSVLVYPSEQRKVAKTNQRANLDNTFESIALAWFEIAKLAWSESHTERTQSLLKNHLFPWVGAVPDWRDNAT